MIHICIYIYIYVYINTYVYTYEPCRHFAAEGHSDDATAATHGALAGLGGRPITIMMLSSLSS